MYLDSSAPPPLRQSAKHHSPTWRLSSLSRSGFFMILSPRSPFSTQNPLTSWFGIYRSSSYAWFSFSWSRSKSRSLPKSSSLKAYLVSSSLPSQLTFAHDLTLFATSEAKPYWIVGKSCRPNTKKLFCLRLHSFSYFTTLHSTRFPIMASSAYWSFSSNSSTSKRYFTK